MMRKLLTHLFFGTFSILLVSCNAPVKKDAVSLYSEIDRSSAPNTLTKNEKSKGWVLLFNGTTTNGWHGYNLAGFPDCWILEDGALTMTTEGRAESQDIITNKKYRGFAFSAEFKLTKGANSGILFQISEDKKYKFPYETGPEYQVIDQDNWPDPLENWQICGANYAMYPPMVKPYKPVGEWNQILLVVDGNNVTQMLNGEVVVKYVKNSEEWTKLRNSGKWAAFPDWGKFDEGFISLQNHGTKVWYRNIKLKELK
jgi:Domain of Unknown Function (DUF1080)